MDIENDFALYEQYLPMTWEKRIKTSASSSGSELYAEWDQRNRAAKARDLIVTGVARAEGRTEKIANLARAIKDMLDVNTNSYGELSEQASGVLDGLMAELTALMKEQTK